MPETPVRPGQIPETAIERHEPIRSPACDIERAFGENVNDGAHVCSDGPGHFVLGRPHACTCGYTWPVQGQTSADDLRGRVARWRRLADCDALAGAPLGEAIHEACDELQQQRGHVSGILRIVSDWCVEANEIGGVDAGDLAWRLERSGYSLPEEGDHA